MDRPGEPHCLDPWGRPVGDGGASGLLKHRSRPATLQKIARSRGAAARWCRDVLSGDVETAKSDPARLLDWAQQKGRPEAPACTSQSARLLDLGLAKLDVFLGDRV